MTLRVGGLLCSKLGEAGLLDQDLVLPADCILAGAVGGVSSQEGGELRERLHGGQLCQGDGQLAGVVPAPQGKEDPLHTMVEGLHLLVESVHNIVLRLQGCHEVEHSEIQCQEGRHRHQEQAADVEGCPTLGPPQVASPHRQDVAHQRCLVAHLEVFRAHPSETD